MKVPSSLKRLSVKESSTSGVTALAREPPRAQCVSRHGLAGVLFRFLYGNWYAYGTRTLSHYAGFASTAKSQRMSTCQLCERVR